MESESLSGEEKADQEDGTSARCAAKGLSIRLFAFDRGDKSA